MNYFLYACPEMFPMFPFLCFSFFSSLKCSLKCPEMFQKCDEIVVFGVKICLSAIFVVPLYRK